MARPGIEQGVNLERVASELSKLKGEKGSSQGPVDHFKIKLGEKTNEKPKITKVFQVMRGKEQNPELVVFDVKRGIEVEQDPNKEKPINVFQEIKSRR